MVDVVVTQHIPEPAATLLREAGLDLVELREVGPPATDELRAAVVGCRALIALLNDPVDATVLDAAGPSLRVVANYAVGFDNIDVPAATERGIAVANTPGVLTDASAELAVALLFATARRVPEADRFVRDGRFAGWQAELLLGMQLRGKVLGLVGAGRIATATGRIARAVGMELLYTNRSPRPDFEQECGAARVELDELLERADVVSLHVPLVPQTRHLIGAPQLARMKSTAILINTARGPVVDEDALVTALRDGGIAAAGLDVYEREPALADGLTALPNAVLLPHLGSGTVETRAAMARLTASAVVAVLCDERPPNLVNPDVWAHRRER
jgi:glyoxylate reductase